MNFCDSEKILHNHHFLTDKIILCAYVASHLGTISGNTAWKCTSGLKAWHSFYNAPWNRGQQLHYILNRVSHLASPSSLYPPWVPVNHTMIKLLHDELDPDSNFDTAVLACAPIIFWGQCRLDELLPTSNRSSTTHIPSCSNIHQSHKQDKLYILTLLCIKTSMKEQDIILTLWSDCTNPIRTLKKHLTHNHLSHNIPLFSFQTPQSTKHLMKECFMRQCNEIWHKAGYLHITSHSFCIGRTIKLLITSISPDIVKKTGRWSSDAFLCYWCSIENIILTHTPGLNSECSHKHRHIHWQDCILESCCCHHHLAVPFLWSDYCLCHHSVLMSTAVFHPCYKLISDLLFIGWILS